MNKIKLCRNEGTAWNFVGFTEHKYQITWEEETFNWMQNIQVRRFSANEVGKTS